MSATVISMSDFQTSAAQARQFAKYVRRPVSVLVHWSESGAWEQGQTVPYTEFEAKAAAVAIPYAGGGYQKTSITVTFDDGETYECRVDLSSTGDLSFTDHCLAMLRHYETDKGRDYYQRSGQESLIEFIQGIDFGADAATVNAELRAAGKAAEQAEEQRQEAEKQAAIEARRLAEQEASRLADEWRAALR